MMILHCTLVRFNEKRLVSEMAIGTEQEISFGKKYRLHDKRLG